MNRRKLEAALIINQLIGSSTFIRLYSAQSIELNSLHADKLYSIFLFLLCLLIDQIDALFFNKSVLHSAQEAATNPWKHALLLADSSWCGAWLIGNAKERYSDGSFSNLLCLEPWTATKKALSYCGDATSFCPDSWPMVTCPEWHVTRFQIIPNSI